MAEVRDLIAAVTTAFTESEVDSPHESQPDGPLSWTGYDESLAAARQRTGETESVICGQGKIGDTATVIVAFDFRFLGGSIGVATGDRIVRAFDQAISSDLPVVSLIATGGSRLQEGMLSLSPLQRIAARCAGFRTATRHIRLAERLNLPVLTLVDTPGAASNPDSERAGLAPAIADLFAAIARAQVPITTLVIGQGGSGGALALCAPDHTWITPDAYFSVIAPELGAAIPKRDPTQVLLLGSSCPVLDRPTEPKGYRDGTQPQSTGFPHRSLGGNRRIESGEAD